MTIIVGMPAFDEKYSDQQREAVACAVVDLKVSPQHRIVTMAAAGELELNGVPVEPFDITRSMVSHCAMQLRKRRAGLLASELAKSPPRDAIETLRRRLISAADHELAAVERKQAKGETVRGNVIHELARAVREAAAIPTPGENTPPKPGARVNGDRDGRPQKHDGTLAGTLLADHARLNGGEPTDRDTTPDEPTTPMEQSDTRNDHDEPTHETTALPGSHLSAIGVAGMGAVEH